MKVTIELEITNCHDCPFSKYSSEHGGSFDWCSHKDAPPNGHDCLIDSLFKAPEWCPLNINT